MLLQWTVGLSILVHYLFVGQKAINALSFLSAYIEHMPKDIYCPNVDIET